MRVLVQRGADLRHVSFCTDILSPVDLVARGSIDYCVRLCVELGVPPVKAVQMATINAAETHLIDDDVGSLSPGRRADIILLDGPLEAFRIDTVFAAGQKVVESGRSLEVHETVPGPNSPTARSIPAPSRLKASPFRHRRERRASASGSSGSATARSSPAISTASCP